MKRYLIITILMMSAIACWREESAFVHYTSPGYMAAYYTISAPGLNRKPIEVETSGHTLRIDVLNFNRYASNIGYLRYGDTKYYDLCIKYGDLKPGGQSVKYYSVGGSDYTLGSGAVAFAEAIDRLHIRSSEAWDANHGAGDLLDDVFNVKYITYMPFIRGGYTGDPQTQIERRISEITPGELVLVREVHLTPAVFPSDSQRQKLTVEFVLDTGETIAYEAVVDFSAIEPK